MNLTFDQLPEAVSRLFIKLDNIEKLLSQKEESQREQSQPINVQEAASYLNLSIPTIYGLVSRRDIPFNKKGKRLYFFKSELDEWIKAGRKKTVAEIKKEVQS